MIKINADNRSNVRCSKCGNAISLQVFEDCEQLVAIEVDPCAKCLEDAKNKSSDEA